MRQFNLASAAIAFAVAAPALASITPVISPQLNFAGDLSATLPSSVPAAQDCTICAQLSQNTADTISPDVRKFNVTAIVNPLLRGGNSNAILAQLQTPAAGAGVTYDNARQGIDTPSMGLASTTTTTTAAGPVATASMQKLNMGWTPAPTSFDPTFHFDFDQFNQVSNMYDPYYALYGQGFYNSFGAPAVPGIVWSKASAGS